jgi:ergothioneine biosynthesis protein EgtB
MRARYEAVRARTERLAAPLSPEDQVVQPMPDASPTKWHRAHVTWFFERFVLGALDGSQAKFNDDYDYIFNSYYVAAGPRHERPRRGMLTRPGAAEITAYRQHVDARMARLLAEDLSPDMRFVVELGLQHEEQHQELLLTDALYTLSQNPLRPAYDPTWEEPVPASGAPRFLEGPSGLVEIGNDLRAGFAFDNESPRHRVWLDGYRIADRLVTNGEWLAFMEDGGYANPMLWMSDGWAARSAAEWEAPLNWSRSRDGAWSQFTLGGLRPVDPRAPVRHVSWYEADAFARWLTSHNDGFAYRLPDENEWEAAAAGQEGREYPWGKWEEGRCNTEETKIGKTTPVGIFKRGNTPEGVGDLAGNVWEWTRTDFHKGRTQSDFKFDKQAADLWAKGEITKYISLLDKKDRNIAVLRGGSWYYFRDIARCADRDRYDPGVRLDNLGFRCVRTKK